MKNLIQSYKFIFIIICYFSFSFADILKPSNKTFDIVKITDENNKTRTYFHLGKNETMIFRKLEEFVEDDKGFYTIKIITRAKISPNSNSNKTFGIELNILEDGVERNKVLKYKKGISSAKKSSKSGFNYTQAGFWLEELRHLEDTEIMINLIEGSPELDVRILIDKISLRESDYIIKTVNKEKMYKVSFIKDFEDSTYIKTKGWYKLKMNNDLQFKIKGPKQIRVLSRSVVSDQNNYDFMIRENGKYMGNYMYKLYSSENDAHIIDNKDKLSLSGYDSFFINVPEGINYYSFSLSDNANEMVVKLQSYINKKD